MTRGDSLLWTIQGGSAPQEVPFSGSRYIKGSDFTSWNIQKGGENCYLGFLISAF